MLPLVWFRRGLASLTIPKDLNMNIKWTVFAFVAGAALSWGVYVPLVHDAANRFGSNLRAFLMVGIAYFLVAVLVPCFFIFFKGDPTQKGAPNWGNSSITYGLLAGVAGAAGALCVIFAAKEAGSMAPLIVAPMVFAGAPIINTIASVTIFAHGKKFESFSGSFYIGLFVAIAGMLLVMFNKPNEIKVPTVTPATANATAGDAAKTPQ